MGTIIMHDRNIMKATLLRGEARPLDVNACMYICVPGRRMRFQAVQTIGTLPHFS
jgi:hypothetical protein